MHAFCQTAGPSSLELSQQPPQLQQQISQQKQEFVYDAQTVLLQSSIDCVRNMEYSPGQGQTF